MTRWFSSIRPTCASSASIRRSVAAWSTLRLSPGVRPPSGTDVRHITDPV